MLSLLKVMSMSQQLDANVKEKDDSALLQSVILENDVEETLLTTPSAPIAYAYADWDVVNSSEYYDGTSEY